LAVASPFKHTKRASSFECMYNRVFPNASDTDTHGSQGLEQANLVQNLARAISLVSG
jgi:hypothetical protein